MIVNNGGAPIKEAGVILIESADQVTANSAIPSIVNIDVATLLASVNTPTTKKSTIAGVTPGYTYTAGNASTGITENATFTIQVTGLQPSKFYSVKGFATNVQSLVQGAAQTAFTTFQTVKANDPVTILPPPSTSISTAIDPTTGESYIAESGGYRQVVKKTISISVTYGTDTTMPAPLAQASTATNLTMGIVYKTGLIGGSEPPITITDNMTSYSTQTTGAFTAKITTPLSNTVYYIKAFTKNTGGITFSPTMIITSGTDAPVLSGATNTGTKIIATLTNNGAGTGGTVLLKRGFIVSTISTSFNTATTKPFSILTTLTSGVMKIEVDEISTLSSFEILISSISGLVPGIQYNIRPYAYNSLYTDSFAYGALTTFTSASTSPTITTTAANTNTITSVGAKLGGTIVSLNGSIIDVTGILYSITQNDTYPTDPITTPVSVSKGYLPTSPNDTTTPFEVLATTLSKGQIYYFKAYAKSNSGTGLGSELSFTTKAEISTALTQTSDTITPVITLTRNIAVNAKGIIWSSSSIPTPTNATLLLPTITSDSDAATPTNATGLIPNTTYYVRGYVTNAGGTFFENEKTVVMLPGFVANVTNQINEGSNQVTILTNLNGSSTTNTILLGNATLTTKGIAYSTTSGGTYTEEPNSTASTNNKNYSTTINGLAVGTKYFFKPYARNSAGIGYDSTESQFTTLVTMAFPTLGDGVTGDIVYVPSTRTLTFTGISVTNTGGSSVTEYGLCYSNDGVTLPTTSSICTATFTTPNSNTTITFTDDIPFPTTSSQVTYKVRAYAKNSGGDAYSATTIIIIIKADGTLNGPMVVSTP
jgi:hypothetical protein